MNQVYFKFPIFLILFIYCVNVMFYFFLLSDYVNLVYKKPGIIGLFDLFKLKDNNNSPSQTPMEKKL